MNAYVAGLLWFVIGSVVTWLVAEIDRAPEGWQDERGFHRGRQPMPEAVAEWAELERNAELRADIYGPRMSERERPR